MLDHRTPHLTSLPRKADVKVAQRTDFPLSPIITFDRAYIDFILFQAYEKKNVCFVKNTLENYT